MGDYAAHVVKRLLHALEGVALPALLLGKAYLYARIRAGGDVYKRQAKHYSPEDMVGRTVVIVANLKPAKLRGIVSEGMILCAEDAEGKLGLVTVEGGFPDGSEVG